MIAELNPTTGPAVADELRALGRPRDVGAV